MRFFSKKPDTSEPPVRPDQVDRLKELMGQELTAGVVAVERWSKPPEAQVVS